MARDAGKDHALRVSAEPRGEGIGPVQIAVPKPELLDVCALEPGALLDLRGVHSALPALLSHPETVSEKPPKPGGWSGPTISISSSSTTHFLPHSPQQPLRHEATLRACMTLTIRSRGRPSLGRRLCTRPGKVQVP